MGKAFLIILRKIEMIFKRNKLINEVDEVFNEVFFSIRNVKALNIILGVENYFLKKGLIVDCDIDARSIKINLLNKKKNQTWDYVTSYIWLENIDKPMSFDYEFSNFAFKVKSSSIESYFPRPPEYVVSYWSDLKELFDSGFFDKSVAELNYPFSQVKSPSFDENTLTKKSDLIIKESIDSGKKIALENLIYSVENLFLKEGFSVSASLSEGKINLIFKNTKRGQWKESEVTINYVSEYFPPTWNKNIDYTNSFLKDVVCKKPFEKENKHYNDFIKFIESELCKNKLIKIIDLKDYPFTEGSKISC